MQLTMLRPTGTRRERCLLCQTLGSLYQSGSCFVTLMIIGYADDGPEGKFEILVPGSSSPELRLRTLEHRHTVHYCILQSGPQVPRSHSKRRWFRNAQKRLEYRGIHFGSASGRSLPKRRTRGEGWFGVHDAQPVAYTCELQSRTKFPEAWKRVLPLQHSDEHANILDACRGHANLS